MNSRFVGAAGFVQEWSRVAAGLRLRPRKSWGGKLVRLDAGLRAERSQAFD